MRRKYREQLENLAARIKTIEDDVEYELFYHDFTGHPWVVTREDLRRLRKARLENAERDIRLILDHLGLEVKCNPARPETFELVESRLFEDKGSGSADD